VSYPIGMDVISYTFERAVGEVLGRANLPRDRAALQARLADIGKMVARMLAEPRALDDISRTMGQHRWSRDRYDLPEVIERAETAFNVKRAGLRLISQGGRHGLVKEGTRQAVEVPAAMQPQVAWVLDRERFAKSELAAAFPGEGAAKLDKLLSDLSRMALVEPA
jgi:hypothetical protein